MLELLDEAVSAGARMGAACRLVGLSRRTLERWRAQNVGDDGRAGPIQSPSHKLTAQERQAVLSVANSAEFRDKSPRQIVPILADRGQYVASESTFYRVLHEEDLMQHRERSQPRRTHKPKEHVARARNKVWCWDITYLRAEVRGTFYYLYLIVDIYSRKIVGWRVAAEECMAIAAELFERAAREQQVKRGELVLHADNGGPMKGSTMLTTLHKLGVLASFSRPRVSDDNPYAEALFRTLKYRPGYPRKPFASLEAARAWVTDFVAWYNGEHLHSGIRYVTPNARHAGHDVMLLAARDRIYKAARARTPSRWTGDTRNWQPIRAVALNPANAETRLLN